MMMKVPHFDETPPLGYKQIVHSMQEQKDSNKMEVITNKNQKDRSEEETI